MTKYKIPLLLPEKRDKIISGNCTQLIKNNQKLKPGDQFCVFTWAGKPYFSNWSWQSDYFTISSAIPIQVYPDYICLGDDPLPHDSSSTLLNYFAKAECINPATSEHLIDILNLLYTPTNKGFLAQIIKWEFQKIDLTQKHLY
ncbi:hypothetical protein [Bacteroides sp.]|uniref:hypothetical protein n=1 Tax=Bacteroides sp. TaxID=29523 RepID=UPI00260C1510|nr:hypothetical protein [Bacteroides sp.]MDD3039106.1 hypothetical protein [Bacteroides sp.]